MLVGKWERMEIWNPFPLTPNCINQDLHAVRRNFFVERVVDVWNYLPPTVNFASLSTFKSSLKSVDFSSYLILKRTV